MKTKIILLIVLMAFTTQAQQTWNWGLSVDNSCNSSSNISDMAYDSLENIIVTGINRFGTLTVGSNSLVPVGQYDCFVASIKKTGALNWITNSGSLQYDSKLSVCTDTANNIYVLSTFNNSYTVSATTLTNSNMFNSGIFILKYNSAGNLIWAKKIGQGEVNTGLIRYNNGFLFINGKFKTTNFNLIFGTHTYSTTFGYDDVFVSKIDLLGNELNTLVFGGENTDDPGGLFITGAGEVLLSGSSSSSLITVDTYTMNARASAGSTLYPTNPSVYLTKLTSNLNVVWAKAIDSAGYTSNVCADALGNIALCGRYSQPGFKVNGNLITMPAMADNGAMLIKFNYIGNVLWTSTLVGTGTHNAESFTNLDMDKNGEIYVTGSSSESNLLSIGSNTFNSKANSLFYVIHYNAGGQVAGVLSGISNSNSAVGCGKILVDANSSISVGGSYTGNNNVNMSPITIYAPANNKSKLLIAQASFVTTSLLELKDNLSINIYPNPAQSQINLRSKKFNFQKISILDITGKLVLEQTANGKISIININHLQGGVYIVQAQTESEQCMVAKFVKVD